MVGVLLQLLDHAFSRLIKGHAQLVGSFLLNGAALDKRVVTALRHWRGNPATCSGSATVTAAAPIVAGSGIGAYRGISGSFTLTATVDEIDAKAGCTATGTFIAQVIVITGTGTVRTG